MSRPSVESEELAGRLQTAGWLRDERMVRAFTDVPRHLFIDEFYIPTSGVVAWSVRRPTPDADHDDEWRRLVYEDRPLVVTVDNDGRPCVTSTAPWLMAAMLDALQIPGGSRSRVLEIGTGTGYNAALLAELVGPAGTVVTVDIDCAAVTGASARLARRYGDRVRSDCLDGREGYSSLAPYDGIIVTAGVTRLPATWLDQLDVAGRLVAPIQGPMGATGVAVIKRHDRGWRGRLLGVNPVGFVPMRGDDGSRTQLPTHMHWGGAGRSLRLERDQFDPSELDRARSTFPFFLQFEAPDLSVISLVRDRPGTRLLTPVVTDLVTLDTASFEPDGNGWVVQCQPSDRVWNTLVSCYANWRSMGAPDLGRYELIIQDPGRQRLVLEDQRSWMLPVRTAAIPS
jgi:protein-L-isoaspartate(D-aspartate) O-methyltransferase